MECSPPVSSVLGIFQARIMEWIQSYSSVVVWKVKVTQLCPTLCNPVDSTVHGILQARILEWVAISFSRVLPSPGINPRSPTLQVVSLPSEPPGKPPDITWDNIKFEHKTLKNIIKRCEICQKNNPKTEKLAKSGLQRSRKYPGEDWKLILLICHKLMDILAYKFG